MAESVRIKFKGEDKVSPALKRINAGVSSLSSKFASTGRIFSSVNKKLLIGLGAISVAFGALAIKAIKSFGEFDRQIKRVQVLAGGTQKDFERLADTAFKLGSSTAFSAQEVAEAFEEFAKAGFNVNEILEASEATLGLATAGNLSLSEAVNIAVAALNAFGREASDTNSVATVLTTTFTNSALTLQDLGQALKFVAPLASNLGISLEEVSATLGTLAQVGIRGSIAGTSLNQALLRLLKPSQKAAEVTENLGVNFFTLNESAQAAQATIQATKDQFNLLKEQVRLSDIEVAKIGSQLAQAKRELKGFGNESDSTEGISKSFSGLQTVFDEARLRNQELRESLEAQEKEFSALRRQVREGSQDFIGLRDTTRQLNDAFAAVDASTVQKATALVEIFGVRGARSVLTLTKELENFDKLFNLITATELRTELVDESSLRAALSAQDSFARQFGLTFEDLLKDVEAIPEGVDKALKDSALDERARGIFRNLRSEVQNLGLEAESIEAVLSDFLPLDSVKDFRKIIQGTDEDFEAFLANINAANQDASTLNKTLLNNLGSALEELQDTITTTFIRIGGAIASRLDLTNVVRNIQQSIEDFSTGGGVEKLADRLVAVFRTIGNFFRGIGQGFKEVFSPDILIELREAVVRNFGTINNEAGAFGSVLGKVLGGIVKGAAQLITKILNTNLIENASNAFQKLGNILAKISPIIGAFGAAFLILSPILGPVFFILSKIVGIAGLFIRGIIGAGKAVSGLVGGASKLTSALTGVAGKAAGVGTAATGAAATSTGFLAKLGAIGASIKAIFATIGAAIGVSAGAAAAIVVAVIGTIIGFINQVRQNFIGLGEDFRTIFTAVGGFLSAVGSAIKESLVDLGALIKPIWEGVKDTFNGLGKILASLVAVVVKPLAILLRNTGQESISAFEILRGVFAALTLPLRLALTILGSVLKVVGAILNFVGDLIGGIVEFTFTVVEAFAKFKEEGFAAFSEVGEVAKRIGVSILRSFIGAIDSMINVFIDLINEVVNVARKIPFLSKLIGDNFKIDKNVLSSLIGFTKEAEKAANPDIQPGQQTGTSFFGAAKSTLGTEGQAVVDAAADPFRQVTAEAQQLGVQTAANFVQPFQDPVNVAQSQASVRSIFPSNEEANQMGRNFGAAFFTGLADGAVALVEIFNTNIKPVFTTMNEALKEFITLFLRSLFSLKIVPIFLDNLARRMFDIFVGGWRTMFNAVIDVTEQSVNTMLNNLEKFFNQLVTVVNKLVSEYNRAADILARDIVRTRRKKVRVKSKSGKSRTKTVTTREILFKGVNIPKLNQFSPVDFNNLQFQRPVVPDALPSQLSTVEAGGFTVNIENFNAASESDKTKLFAEIDAFIAKKLGELVRL